MGPATPESTETDTSHTDTSDREPYLVYAAEPYERAARHSATFVGLYLFTFFVYFRPYELFDALGWTSSFAFFLAIFSLLAYLPTQLSVAGTLTFRSREVNVALLL